MDAARDSSFRRRIAGLAGLCALGLLAGCGEPGSGAAPTSAAPQAAAPCPILHSQPGGDLGRNDAELLAAAATGDVGGAQQSLEQGANVNAGGALKRTPLFVAAFCDRPDMVKLLLDKGGRHDATDANGMSPLHAAVIVGATETVKILLANGANVDGRDLAGRTALHVAAATGQLALVELLLAAKANPAARDKSGKTAATLARDNGHSASGKAIRQWQEKHRTPPAKQPS
jgi:ankyrin repeat protein